MIPARGFCRRTCTTCRLNRLSGIRDATKLSRNWSGLSVDMQRNGHEIRSDVLLICNDFGTKLVIAFCRDATKLSRNWLIFSVQVQRNCCETGSVFCVFKLSKFRTFKLSNFQTFKLSNFRTFLHLNRKSQPIS